MDESIVEGSVRLHNSKLKAYGIHALALALIFNDYDIYSSCSLLLLDSVQSYYSTSEVLNLGI